MRFCVLSLFACILTVFPAFAQDAGLSPFNLTARYDFHWGGVPLGKVSVRSREAQADYDMYVRVRSRGMVNVFVKHKSDTVVKGKRVDGRYVAQRYEANYQTKNKKKHVSFEYDEAGRLVKEIVEPPDTDRPKVPEAEKAGAGDVLTTVFLIRQGLAQALRSGEENYETTMYDGHRLSRLHFEMKGRKTHLIQGKKRPVVHVTAERMPLAGFTEKEIGKIEKEPLMHIYFSDDEAFIPLSMEVTVFMALMKGELAKQCATPEECY